MSLFLDPPVLLVVARIVTTSLVFSRNVDVVVVEDAIFMMAVVIASVMAIEYDNIDRVTSAGK
jgi:energy-converting hydrogenase Eha subunit F